MSVRLSDEQINFLTQQAQETGTSFSEQLRAGLDAYIDLSMKIKDGNFLCTFKSPNRTEFYELMHELEALMLEHKDLGLEFAEYLVALANALQFDYAMKATEIVPEELVQLNGCREHMKDEDWK
ncbi:MAG: hypothetical protein RSB66_03660 [Clostridium sp.]